MLSRVSVVLACVLLLLAACADDKASHSGQGVNAGNTAGAAGAANGGGAGISGGGGNVAVAGSAGVSTAGTGGGAGSGGSEARQPISIDACGADNTAGLSTQDAQTLMAAGSAPAGMTWLYPYDGTIFPRGMLAPTLMWKGGEGDRVYVHIHSSLFDYRGCLKTTGPQQLQLPQDIWQQAGDQATGSADPFSIELTVKGTSGALGPITEKVVIAQATVKGSIYYNSYVSSGSATGSVYRIAPGAQAQLFLGGVGCTGCHAVAASGARMVSHNGAGPGSSYVLTPTTAPNPPVLASAPNAAFVGLSPDGTVYLATAHPAGAVRPQGTPFEALTNNDAIMYETDTGNVISGTGVPVDAMMPSFSPDGKWLAFNPASASTGRSLSVLGFDLAARKASNQAMTIVTITDGYPGWPFFLPDDKALIYAVGASSQFSGGGAGVMQGTSALAPKSDLYIVDIASATSTLLARAMGFAKPGDSTSYLPGGADDLHKHYYPTVSPVAAGGYYWVFFDSIRSYGNMGSARQLWGTAVTISADGTYDSDPSHPAFYVTGQAFGSGNHRAFTALDPCREDGQSCETGIDCCSGFCTNAVCGVPDQPRCSNTNEACTTSADCCNAAEICLGGFCGEVIPE